MKIKFYLKLLFIVFNLIKLTIGHSRLKRIINGSDYVEKQYQVLLKTRRFVCGGSLISDHWILTAAHCIYNSSDLRVLSSLSRQSRQKFIPQRQAIYPKFEVKENLNDIALIKLSRKVKNARHVILQNTAINNQTIITISGWGVLGNKHTLSTKLQKANLKVINSEICRAEYKEKIDFETAFCAKGANGENPCSGDSGGPAVIKDTLVQIGIISFGSVQSCESKTPTGFTKISPFIDWIRNVTGIEF